MAGAISFEVGAIFAIEDRASPVLRRLSTLFEEIGATIKTVEDKLAAFGRGGDMFGGITAGIDKVLTSLRGIGPAAETAQGEMSAAMAKAGLAATEAASKVDGIAAAYRNATQAARDFASAAAAGGGPRRARGGGGDGGGGAGSPPGGDMVPFGGGEGAFIGGAVGAFTGERMAGGGGGRSAYDAWQEWQRGEQLRIAGSGGGGALVPAGGGPPVGPGSERYMPLNYDANNPKAKEGSPVGWPELLAALFGIRSYRLAAEGDLAARQTLEGLNIRPSDAEFEPDMLRVKRMARAATDDTIFSYPQGEKMAAGFAGVMMQTNEMGMEQVERLFPIAARVGELSEQRGAGSATNEAVAAGRFAHLAGATTPDKMMPFFDLVNAIAKVEHSSIGRQQEIMRYGMPMALAAGMTPEEAAAQMAYAQEIMGSTTRAGTAMGQFLTSGITAATPRTPAEHRRHDRAAKDFEEALKLDPQAHAEVQRSLKDPARITALKELGIVGPKGEFLGYDPRDPSHRTIMPRFMEQKVESFGADPSHNLQQVMTTLKNAFGQIGMRWAAMFLPREMQPGMFGAMGEMTTPSTTMEQFIGNQQARTGLLGKPTVLQEQADLMQSPMQRFQHGLAMIDTTFSSMAESTFPALVAATKPLVAGLAFIRDYNKDHPAQEQVGALGIGGLLMMYAGQGLKWAGSHIPGWKGMLGSGLGTVLSGAGRFSIGLGIGNFMDHLFGLDHELKPGEPDRWLGRGGKIDRFMFSPFSSRDNTSAVTPRKSEPSSASGEPTHAAAAPNNVTINNHFTFNGVIDEAAMRTIMERMKDGIKNALAMASGAAGGTEISPLTTGAVP